MKIGYVAAAVAACFTVPAGATTIVQTDNEALALQGFNPFNTSLGTLNSVTLEIFLLKDRWFSLNVPSAAPTSKEVTWQINGIWRLNNAALPGGQVLVPISGAGTINVALPTVVNGMAYGDFKVSAAGYVSLNLDPANFVTNHIVFDGIDTGRLNAPGVDSTFTIAGDYGLSNAQFRCQGGDDSCGSAGYRLTYDYTAFGAVPEPGTWALLLLGFLGLGVALRQRREPAWIAG